MIYLTSSSIIYSITGSVGTPAVHSSGLALSTVPILGTAPAVSPLVAPLVQSSISALAGLQGAALSIPALTVPTIDTIGVPSECLQLKNMFDPTLEVSSRNLLILLLPAVSGYN